jgi:hypothetical protein
MSVRDYLLSFIIGSSAPVTILYFNAVSNYTKKGEIDVDYHMYTKLAPFYLGLLNMFGLYLAEKFNLSRRVRFLLISFIGIIIVGTSIKILGIYDFSKKDWLRHYLGLIIIYLFVFNIIMFYLHKMLDCPKNKKISGSDNNKISPL